MIDLPYSKSCFVCGSRNPIGLKLRFRTDGAIVQARFTPEAAHNGFINVTHGGLLATVLDEVMVWGCAVRTKKFSYCAEMTVRYVSPARPGTVIIAEGKLVENKRERIYLASGVLKGEDGSVICTSTGKYMPVKGGDLGMWMADFEGNPEQLRALFGSTPA
jgi:uncharacterized protein (TIGR00369 family)